MNIRLCRRGAASPPQWIVVLGWALLGALVAGCQPKSVTLKSAAPQRAQFAVSFDEPTFPAPQAPLDETPITSMETVGAPAGD
jgi:hypothetical protein